jgi:hypothetical protein
MTILEHIIDDISSVLHGTATQKTDARASKKVISMARALGSSDVAQAILMIVRNDPKSRDFLPLWNTNIKDQSRLKETIFFSAELLDLVTPPLQTELVGKHLEALHEVLRVKEVEPHLKDFTAAPEKIRRNITEVLRTAVALELALEAKSLTLESVSPSWYGFLYITSAQSEVVREIILSSVAEGNVGPAVDVNELKKKFNSPASRVKRAKTLFGTIRGAAESVEYSKGMGLQGYASKIQEKAGVASR